MQMKSQITRSKRSGMQPNLSRALRFALIAVLWAILPGRSAPTLQIIYPVGGADVEGVVNLRIFAYEGAILTQTAQVDTVKFFRKADTASKILLIRIASTG